MSLANNLSVSPNKLVVEICAPVCSDDSIQKTSQIGLDLPGPIFPLKQADFWPGGFKIFIFFFLNIKKPNHYSHNFRK